MPTFTPPTVEANIGFRNARTRNEWVNARIAGPFPTGQTLFRVGATWHLQTSPSQSVLDTADLVFLGGHLYTVDDEILDEILAAGFSPYVYPEAFPSTDTFPSTALFPSS